MSSPAAVLCTQRHLHARGEAFVCLTVARIRGEISCEAGAKMLVAATGSTWGTLGGGPVEAAALAYGRQIFDPSSKRTCQVVTWKFRDDLHLDHDGDVTVVFEHEPSRSWPIVLFGAGHVSQALVRVLAGLECEVTVYDTRPEMLARLAQASHIHPRKVNILAEAVGDLPEEAFVALMTQGHRTDKPILEEILKTRTFPYLGVIGSASKAAVLRRELREAGLTGDLKTAFRCPIGLPIGNDTPEEIAISIAAEMLQVRDAGKIAN